LFLGAERSASGGGAGEKYIDDAYDLMRIFGYN
jgi:hypothetical protein